MSEATNNPVEEIDLTKIDWNKLTVSEFNAIELKFQQKKKLQKKTLPRASGLQTIKLKGNFYEIKSTLYDRLKAIKSEKSKQKLIDEIISSHNKIETII